MPNRTKEYWLKVRQCEGIAKATADRNMGRIYTELARQWTEMAQLAEARERRTKARSAAPEGQPLEVNPPSERRVLLAFPNLKPAK